MPRSVQPLLGRWPWVLLASAGIVGSTFAETPWVLFEDKTAERLVASDGLGVLDPDEKDYAWGDVDRDGDIDLVVARKQIGTSTGKRPNVLFVNEGGVLVDRTAEFASASDIPGDHGFLTPTNDRDVVLVDVDNDDWLDIVTATTLSDGDPKHLGHPRIYHNLGDDPESGQWRGFRYEDARIPLMLLDSGQSGFQPRFCGVAAGDVTGDGFADLYFIDYDSGAFGPPELPGADFNDRLLVNDGTGHFSDATAASFSGSVGGLPFEVSTFGTAVEIADMNGDGRNDIVKDTTLSSPILVNIAYNDPAIEGSFDTYSSLSFLSPYSVAVGDLNNDDRLDIVVADDGTDRYFLNQGTNPDRTATLSSHVFSYTGGLGDDGFDANARIADLNHDGWGDVVITGGDVDTPNCGQRTDIYRNLGGSPGDPVVLIEETGGTGCTPLGAPPTCLVAGIPTDQLVGVHDVAAFDVNGDGWNDLVLGKCTGTRVLINRPLSGLVFALPNGLPTTAPPGQAVEAVVQITGFGGAGVIPNSARLVASIDGGPPAESPLVALGLNQYRATLPAAPACTGTIDFHFAAEDDVNGVTFAEPSTAPLERHRVVSALGTELAFSDDIEGDVSAWAVLSDASLSAGAWEQAVPVGTLTGTGQQAAPSEDAEPAPGADSAFVTQNGVPGGAVGAADVDGGPTDLVSPAIDLSGTDGIVSFSRWFYSGSGNPDTMTVSVTGDGSNWYPVSSVLGLDNNHWKSVSFKVGDFISPTSSVKVRFRVSDNPSDSITEAAIDAFRVERFVCPLVDAGSGRVPDLTAERLPGGMITLSWGASCQPGDTDFAVYEGTLGDFTSHEAIFCSTANATSVGPFVPGAVSTYYLVVPHDGVHEGSYGDTSTQGPRPPAAAACLPQSVAACP